VFTIFISVENTWHKWVENIFVTWFFFCVGVMHSGEYDACDVTLSVYPHQASLKNMPDHGGNRTTTFGILAQCSANTPFAL
jgi:hypothetical protein